MKVELWFQRSSQPVRFDNAQATYQKGDLFCVGYEDDFGKHVKKYPVTSLFCVHEEEFPSSQPKHVIPPGPDFPRKGVKV